MLDNSNKSLKKNLQCNYLIISLREANLLCRATKGIPLQRRLNKMILYNASISRSSRSSKKRGNVRNGASRLIQQTSVTLAVSNVKVHSSHEPILTRIVTKETEMADSSKYRLCSLLSRKSSKWMIWNRHSQEAAIRWWELRMAQIWWLSMRK